MILIRAAAIVLFCALAASAIWWQVYKFHDCRRVGHTKLYCIADIGH